MFNFGFGEIVVIAVIALVFIGPKQLPEVARVVGRLLNEFKRATGDITGSFVQIRDDADSALRKTKEDLINQVTKDSEALEEIKASVDDVKNQFETSMTDNDAGSAEPAKAQARKKKKAAKKSDV